MTSKRNISKASPVSGATFTADVADTVNALSAYLGGNAVTVAGTNTITCTLDITSGFTGPGDGMLLTIEPAVTNTGAVTLNVASTGAKAVVDSAGDALTGGELVAGSVYLLFFVSADDHWRIAGGASSSASTSNASFSLLSAHTATGAWSFTAPHDCRALIIAHGAGGSGGSGTRSSGGGGGGMAVAERAMSSGDVISGIVGAGGAGVSSTNNGNAGANTTVSSGDISISISAAGGSGGLADNTNPVAGASGGAATGGDQNFTGGDSGNSPGGSENSGGGSGCAFEDGVDSITGASTTTAGGYVSHDPIVRIPWFDIGFTSGAPLCGSDAGGGVAGGRGAGSGAINSGTSGAGGDGFVIIWYTQAAT